MTNPTTTAIPARPLTPMAQASINDNLPTSSPSPKITLIGLACIVGFIGLFSVFMLYR
jgi:hypothetical protein